METDSRWSQRVPFHHNAKIGRKNQPGRISFVTDLSEGGICLKTNTVFSPGTKVYLEITIDSIDYNAEGVVAWAESAPPALSHQVKSSMGIKFSNMDQAILKAYNKQLQVSVYVGAEQ